jgi:hypothetical protein
MVEAFQNIVSASQTIGWTFEIIVEEIQTMFARLQKSSERLGKWS